MIHYQPLQEYAVRYAALPMIPIRIICELYANSPVTQYDPIMLDGIIAAAVVREATHGEGLPPAAEGYHLPLPLQCLYRAEEMPLWAASCLWPLDGIVDMQYLHKRAQSGQFTKGKNGKFVISTTTGRWMERRVPTPTVTATFWEALAIGDPDEVRRLLELIPHIGKRRGAGLGPVKQWHVEVLDALTIPDLLVRNGALSRPLPVGARGLIDNTLPDSETALVGWTPPYWLPSNLRNGWRVGTPITRVTVEELCI